MRGAALLGRRILELLPGQRDRVPSPTALPGRPLLPVAPSRTLMEVYLDHRRGGKGQEPRVTVLDSNLCTSWDACLHLLLTPCEGHPPPPLLTPTRTVLTEPGMTRNDLKKETFGSSPVA